MTGPTPARGGWTLAELLCVVAICSGIGCILVPVISLALSTAGSTACLSNLRQVGMCTLSYAADHDGRLPAEGNEGVDDPAESPAWFYRLPPYLEQENVKHPMTIFQCPSYDFAGPVHFSNATPKSYKMNAYLDDDGRPIHYRLGTRVYEAETVLFADAVAGETGMGQWGHLLTSGIDDQRHGGRVTILFLDGHTVRSEERRTGEKWKEKLRWTPW